jgi:phosphoglycolate phosphatase-like HAD superfamily hydrolase
MVFEQYIESKKNFIIGFDDVLFPEKDYLLQVYYLFAEFMEYTEQLDAKQITEFMQRHFFNHGSVNIFERTALEFGIPQKYEANFILLHENARLPLKLLLFKQILVFLQEVVIERKNIYLLVIGNPKQQLNKIKQIEWNGLESYLKVYFSEEIEPIPTYKSLEFLINQHSLKKEEVLTIGLTNEDEEKALNTGVDFLFATNLL